jgi:hypothetical protein
VTRARRPRAVDGSRHAPREPVPSGRPEPPCPLASPDDPRYAALWERSPGRSPFSHPAAVAAYAEAFGLPVRVLAVEDEGEWAAAVPVFEKRRGPFVASALPPVCPLHRPLLAAPLRETDSHDRTSPLDRLLARLGAEVDQATFALGDDDLRPYAWAGWTVTPRATYRLALDGDLMDGFSSSTRRSVRKQAGRFDLVEGPEFAADAVELMLDGYRRHDAELGLDAGRLVRLAEAFGRAGLARTFAARRDGTTEAAFVAPSDGRTASYWIAGSRPGYAMTVLIAHALGQLQAEGVGAFDFVGANTPSIAEFKRQFGPTLAPAPIARRVSHPALRLADRLLGR